MTWALPRKVGLTRAAEPRLVVDKIVQFRQSEDVDWHFGRTRNISRSGLLFSSSAYLQVGSVIEVQLRQADGHLCFPEHGGRCLGQVVRRVLMSWPEVVPLFAIRFVEGKPTEVNHLLSA